jgi:hypothetical protein
MRTVIEDAIAANVFDHYDLLFTDSLVNCHIGLMKNLTKAFDQVEIPPAEPLRLTEMKLMDLTQIFFAAFQSYVVGVNSIDRVLQCYQQEIANGLKTPVDIFIQQRVIAGKLRAACVFPFLTSIRIEDISNSTIRSEGGGASEIVMAVLRYLFFVGRDLDYAKRILDNATSYGRQKPRTTD